MENAHIKIKLPCTVPANGSNSQFQQQHPTAWLHASCSLCIVFVSPFVPRQTAWRIPINRCATVQVLYKIIPSTIICIGVTLLYAQHNSLQLELIFLDGLLCIGGQNRYLVFKFIENGSWLIFDNEFKKKKKKCWLISRCWKKVLYWLL